MPEAAGIQRKLSLRSSDCATAASGRDLRQIRPGSSHSFLTHRVCTARKASPSGVVAAVFRFVLPLATERHSVRYAPLLSQRSAQFEITRSATQCGAL